MPAYQPPHDILEVLQAIEFEEALEPTIRVASTRGRHVAAKGPWIGWRASWAS